MAYKDSFAKGTFQMYKATYKYLQESVFEALKALTPSRAAFELSIREESGYKMHWDYVDNPTKTILGDLLCDLLDDEHFIVTSHDLYFAWCRMRELIYTHKLMQQNLIQQAIADDGSITYTLVGESNRPKYKVHKHSKSWAKVTSFT